VGPLREKLIVWATAQHGIIKHSIYRKHCLFVQNGDGCWVLDFFWLENWKNNTKTNLERNCLGKYLKAYETECSTTHHVVSYVKCVECVLFSAILSRISIFIFLNSQQMDYFEPFWFYPDWQSACPDRSDAGQCLSLDVMWQTQHSTKFSVHTTFLLLILVQIVWIELLNTTYRSLTRGGVMLQLQK
jgi:hypothetical protein